MSHPAWESDKAAAVLATMRDALAVKEAAELAKSEALQPYWRAIEEGGS